ncbi:MAG: aminotransferase class I/II-fold pyridoxal phosphate-dependent enzyme [Gemmobacter sp.]|uniref:aminotransferase class I/II-fold pyridoxal phosphate-dependent enzyme n=1 Tax=Gemmobacter sp. TaxID=1898957 RepID=UPI001A442402|nr:aminotransferase class I/II-fold pyridoxal phosphate-dependent enzyme [Gemmobacter sp.]MBL8563577.1 aminotransferase class I/II-fold pyridoxal phosphate-dependent enzyme [Gemmobacter sp.]
MPRCHDLSALLATSAEEHLEPRHTGLMERWAPVADWMAQRLAEGFDASCKSNTARIGPRVVGRDRAGRGLSGINFAMEDPLSLSSHPRILTAATAAARRYGVHAAGSASQMGLCTLGTQLEARLAAHLGYAGATLFPCGWSAAFGALRTLLRAGDHVLICGPVRDGVRQGAAASGARVHLLPEADCLTLADRLDHLRDHHPQAGILVVLHALGPCGAGLPDLGRVQALCRRHATTLMVDVSDDLGVMGETGGGVIEMQGLPGQVDIVTGSLASVFAANGGFVASNHPALKPALRLAAGAQTECSAMSPVQAAVALAVLDLVTGEEGVIRRARLATNAARLRAGLHAAGFVPVSMPGPVVTLRFPGLEQARRLTAEMLAHGVMLNLDEAPGPAAGAPHPMPASQAAAVWRLRVMADHSPEDIDMLVTRLVEARQRLDRAARQDWEDRLAGVA